MIRTLMPLALAGAALAFTASASADDVEHYAGKEAKTLEQAVANLDEYNARLDAVLNNGELTDDDLAKAHELSYTIENALKRIQTELGTLAGDLETMHLSSERGEADTALKHGNAYLEQARTLTGE